MPSVSLLEIDRMAPREFDVHFRCPHESRREKKAKKKNEKNRKGKRRQTRKTEAARVARLAVTKY